jgi:hypothetical protein
MDTLRSGPTPYGSCSVAESIPLPVTALPTTGNAPSAAGTIGNCDRFSVSRNWLQVEYKGFGIRRGYRLHGHHGGIGRDLAPHPAARSQHHGIDWDRLSAPTPRRAYAAPRRGRLCAPASHRLSTDVGGGHLCGPVPRRSKADIYGDCLRGSTLGRSQGTVSGGWGRGRGEGAP